MYLGPLLILIAPNVGEQMGGEAMKALNIFREIRRIAPATLQIAHGRNRRELEGRLALENVHFVDDDAVSMLLWRSRILRGLLDTWFSIRAVRLAHRLARERGVVPSACIFYQTEPNSPVVPRAVSRDGFNVFGPINGNIYYPAAFRANESLRTLLRRRFHFAAQYVHRWLPSGMKCADLILVAGGQRTHDSLLAAGCPSGVLVATLDCGVPDALFARERVRHANVNRRFVHFGRLVFHKGTSLAIEAVARTSEGVCLDIIGVGPELEHCRALVASLGLTDRVRFLGWKESHEDLLRSFADYRGMVLPSLEDANGIVVQEAMALGLPPICLDWGGPALLVRHDQDGILVPAGDRDQIISGFAVAMDRLALDGDCAERMAASARGRAQTWRWSSTAQEWYQLILNRCGFDSVPSSSN